MKKETVSAGWAWSFGRYGDRYAPEEREVTYLTWTEDNLLRQVSYLREREDKPARQVV